MAMFIFRPFAAPLLRNSGQFAVFPVLKHWALICRPSGPIDKKLRPGKTGRNGAPTFGFLRERSGSGTRQFLSS